MNLIEYCCQPKDTGRSPKNMIAIYIVYKQSTNDMNYNIIKKKCKENKKQESLEEKFSETVIR